MFAVNWRNTLIILVFSPMALAWTMQCYCGCYDRYVTVCPDNVLDLYNYPECFAKCPEKGTCVLCHGFNLGGWKDNVTCTFLRPYINYGMTVCLVNASTELAGPAARYPIAAGNAEIVGKELGAALCKLINAGLYLFNFRLVGFSMGAHLAGTAGRWLIRYCNKTLERISGLDPAGPSYDGMLHLERLNESDARFVDILHTDPGRIENGRYGITTSTGTCDIYVNPKCNRQPGCPEGFYEPMTPPATCSHVLALKLDAEALFFPENFIATGAPDADTWAANNGALINPTTIGQHINMTCRGNHYMSTNGEPPYGKGMGGVSP